MKILVITMLFLIMALPAFARDLMASPGHLELFPTSRTAYQEKFDARKEQYEVNGRNYIDDLYETHAETAKTAKQPMLPEATLDAVLDSADKQNIAAQKNKAAVKKSALPVAPKIPSLKTSSTNINSQ